MRIMKFCYSLQSRASLGLQRISKLGGGALIPDRRVLLGYGSILALAWGSVLKLMECDKPSRMELFRRSQSGPVWFLRDSVGA